MTQSTYPQISRSSTLDDVIEWVLEVSRLREQEDIGDFNNLNNVFISGRKVNKVPSSSADVSASDRAGDFNYDDSFIYIAVISSGNLVWRRVAIASW